MIQYGFKLGPKQHKFTYPTALTHMGDIGQDGDFDALMSFYSHFRGAKNHTSKNNLNLKIFSELLNRLTQVNGDNFKLEIFV